MILDRISQTKEGPPQTAAGQKLVISDTSGNAPRAVYRKIIYLHFANAQAAEQLVLDADSSVFKASLGVLDYDALTPPSSIPKAGVTTKDGAVVVTLDGPREVQSAAIHLANGALSYTVELYRIDKDALSEKATDSFVVGGAAFGRRSLSVFETSGMVLAEVGAIATAAGAQVSMVAPLVNDGFTDIRFALRAKSGGQYQPFQPSALSAVSLRSYPTTPRISLIVPSAGNTAPPELRLVWQAAGEIGKGTPASAGTVDAGSALAKGISELLATAGSPIPANYSIGLAVESDAPCIFQIGQLSLPWHFVSSSFVGSTDKQVLRFQGGGVQTQSVAIRLPREAKVSRATLRVQEGLGGGRDTPLGFGGSADPRPEREQAVALSGSTEVAQRARPVEALSVSGLALALMPLAAKTEVVVELREDWQGEPTGSALVSGKVTLEAAGVAGWMTIAYPKPIVLSSQGCWISARATSGSAVWFGETAEGSVVVSQPGGPSRLLPSMGLLHRFVSDQAAKSTAVAGFRLDVAGTPSEPPVAEGRNITVALGPALANYLAAASTPGPVEVSLSFSSSLKGSITVYPPAFEYDL